MNKLKNIVRVIILLLNLNIIQAQNNFPEKFPEPSSAITNSPYEFAKFVKDTFETDYEKAQFIYHWIVNNITYDVKAYLRNEASNYLPEDVLDSKKAVCEGFSNLFDYLATESGVIAYKVSGYVADNIFRPCKQPTRSKHAWNSFYAEGEWHLVDVTWGSGYIKNQSGLNKLTLKVFKLSKISSKYEFIVQPDYSYFDPDKREFSLTHIPEDPVWQLTDTLHTLAVFDCYNSTGNSGDNKFVLEDSYKNILFNYKKQNPSDRFISSGRRAYNFNNRNPRVLATSYLNAGIFKFNLANSLSGTKPEELFSHYTICAQYFDSAMYYLLFDKSDLKLEMKSGLNEQKKWYKTLSKTTQKDIKTNIKRIGKNDKSLTQSLKRKDKLETLIKTLKKQNYDLYYDEKIFDVERPLQELPEDLVNEKIAKINSNNNIFIETKKAVNQIFDDVDNAEDFLDSNVEHVFSLIDTNIFLQNAAFELLAQFNPLNIPKVDTLYSNISENKEEALNIKADAAYKEKTGFKESDKLLKNGYKTMQQIAKENKKLYIEIKKISSEERDEDYLYAIENENLIEENNHLIALSKKSIDAIDSRKKYMKEENKLLKKEIKTLKQLDKIINAYYDARVKQTTTYYHGELQWNTNAISQTKTYVADCKKALKENAID